MPVVGLQFSVCVPWDPDRQEDKRFPARRPNSDATAIFSIGCRFSTYTSSALSVVPLGRRHMILGN